MEKRVLDISCGFLIKCKDEYLICRATGFSKWSIPKGKKEPLESDLQTAIRELEEETGIDLITDDLISKCIITKLYEYYLEKQKKHVIVFLLECDEQSLKETPLICKSTFTNKQGKQLPEIDAYRWVKVEEMKPLMINSQQPMVDKLLEKTGRNA